MTEKTLVEDHLIELLIARGWKFCPADELARESYEDPLLTGTLGRHIRALNAERGITDTEVQQTLNELRVRGTGPDGNRQILDFLKRGVPVKFEKERVVKFVQLLDHSDAARNECIVSRQVIFQSGDREIRADIVLFINGIPLVIIECKNPVSISGSWYQAYTDIKKYEQKVPELFKYVQLGVAAEHETRYFPIEPWQDKVRIERWREAQVKASRGTDLSPSPLPSPAASSERGGKNLGQDKVRIERWCEDELPPLAAQAAMLAPAMLLELVRSFVMTRVTREGHTKVVARYMQYRAVNKIVARARAYAQGSDERNKGLIWHWQGSGKTLTMLFAADKLALTPELENPTVLFVVDRRELEEQLQLELAALGLTLHAITSVAELRAAVAHDGYCGRRGLLVTLVHKFRPVELEELAAELERREWGGNTIRTRRNVIVLIDEGHRTQYGTLAATMRRLLPAAAWFAFTGTPIAKRGRDTWQEFSYPPDELYFDRYFISESLRDGFTKKIARLPRLEKEVHLDRGLLESFLTAEEEELPDEVREEVREAVRERLTTIKAVMKHPDRLKKIADDVRGHFVEAVDNRFKAMLVAVDREACVFYKRELDKHLPAGTSEIVMTYTAKDKPEIAAYSEELRGRHPGRDFDEINRDIIDRFRNEDQPRLLIVTDMLLTGFDVPVLQTLYLDKPLKEHRLLQAMARTNRPYGDLKEMGLVVDYVGVLRDFTKALGMYGERELLKLAVIEPAAVADEFNDELKALLHLLHEVPTRDYTRASIIGAIEVLTAREEAGEEFIERYKKARRLFELLGAAPLKAERISDYRWLSAVYVYYRKEVLNSRDGSEEYIERHFTRTLEHIYRTTEIAELNRSLPQLVFDEQYLERLYAKVPEVTERAANIVFTLNRFVLVDKEQGGILLTIADKVEDILQRWRDKHKDYERICRDGAAVVNEVQRLQERQRQLGFTDLEYAILLLLERRLSAKPELIADARTLVQAMRAEMFSGWALQPTARKKIERELRSHLRKAMPRYGITYETMDAIFGELRDAVLRYGDGPHDR